MPLYEYKCERCGDTFEIIQKFSDQPLTTHDGCGGAVERLISTSALQFKGSGWYVTDYAKSGSGQSKNGQDGGDSKPDSSSKSEGGKSESSKSEGSKSEGTKPESTKTATPAPAASTSKSDNK